MPATEPTPYKVDEPPRTNSRLPIPRSFLKYTSGADEFKPMVLMTGIPSIWIGENTNCPPDGKPLTNTLFATSPPPPSAVMPGMVLNISAWLLNFNNCNCCELKVETEIGICCCLRPDTLAVTMTVFMGDWFSSITKFTVSEPPDKLTVCSEEL